MSEAKPPPAADLTLEDMQEFFSITLEMLCIAGYDGYFKRLNPTWTRVLGHSMEALLAEPFLNFVHPDDRDATVKVAAEAMAGGKIFSFRNRYRCRDGSHRMLEWTCAPSPERKLLCAVARDVTVGDREQQRLSHLVKVSTGVLFSLTVNSEQITGCTFMSENVCEQLGYTASELVGDGSSWLKCIHPDDLPKIYASYPALLQLGKQELRYRFRHKDGVYRWVHDERKLLRDADDKPVEIVGTCRDITVWV